MKMRALAALALALAGLPAMAQKPYAGAATGNLTVDGKPIPLKYAYVVDVDNVEEAGLRSGTRKSITIVLADRALPFMSVCDREAPYSERRSIAQVLTPLSKSLADRMYGIVLKIDPAKANPLRAQLLYPGSDNLEFGFVGTEYPDRVIGIKRAGGFISGTALLPASRETGVQNGPKKYQYKVSFRAPILTEEAVKENLEGPAALASAPGAVLKSYMEAGKKGDIVTVRKLTAKPNLSYLENKDVLESFKHFEVDKLPEQVKRVVVRGDGATVVVVSEQPGYSQTMMRLIREKGDWKLCWP